MKLERYLKDRGISLDEFAALVGIEKHGARTVQRWAKGTRIPRPDAMRRIHQATGGAVTANDFLAPANDSPEQAA